jgi:thiol-disulfide isomerase/thioredoxin
MRRLLILGLGLTLCAAALAQIPAGPDPAPELVLRDLQGGEVALHSLRGRIVVLNFWATWCTPCRAEMPMLTRLQAEYAVRGVTVVGASTDDASTAGRVEPFLRRYRIDFPIWMGATTAEMQAFGLGTALPATAMLDAEGNIVGRIVGPLEEDDLRHRLEWLLGGRSGPAPEAFVDNIAKAQREHEEETGHRHGSVALEGASSVPS